MRNGGSFSAVGFPKMLADLKLVPTLREVFVPPKTEEINLPLA